MKYQFVALDKNNYPSQKHKEKLLSKLLFLDIAYLKNEKKIDLVDYIQELKKQ